MLLALPLLSEVHADFGVFLTLKRHAQTNQNGDRLMKINFAQLATSVVLSLTSISAFAEQVSQVLLTEKDWSVTKITDSEAQTALCVAETKKVESKIVSDLKLIVSEAENQSAQIILTATGLPAEVTKAYVRPDSKTLYPLLVRSVNTEAGTTELILLPHRNEEVVDLLLEKSVLDIYFGEGKAAVLARVSLRGSTKVIQKTIACRASKSIVNESLSDKIKKDLKKAAPIEGTLDQLLAIDAQLHQLDAQLIAKKDELKKTQAGLKEQRSKEAQLKSKITSIAQAVLKTQKEVSDQRLKLTDQQNLLAQSKTDLPLQQEKIPALVAAKDQAQAALDPVKAQVRKLESELSSLKSQEASLESQVQDLSSNRIFVINSLNQMDNELANLRQERLQVDFQASQVSDLFRRKEFEYRNYDVEFEVRRMLDSNFQYRNYQNQLEDLRRRQQTLPGEIGSAQAQVSVFEINLSQCQAAQPAQDCGMINARLQEARALLNAKNSELNQIHQQFENVRVQMNRIEQESRFQAQSFKNRLLTEMNHYGSQLRELEQRAIRIDQRSRDLQQFDIPRARQDLQNIESNLAQAEDRLVDATARVRRKQNELSQFKKENQYELLSDNLKAAQKALSQVQDLIATAQKNITDLPAKIEATTKKLTAAETLLAQQSASLATEEANLLAVTTVINELLNQEKAAADMITSLEQQITAGVSQFQGVAKFLSPAS